MRSVSALWGLPRAVRSPARCLAASRHAASLAQASRRALSTETTVAAREESVAVVEAAAEAPLAVIVKNEEPEAEVDALALEVARKELEAKLTTESITQINDPQVSLFLFSLAFAV
jgi:hypothetical protein